MPELIQQYAQQLSDRNGVTYEVFVYGEPRSGGTWEGWIEFRPLDDTQPILRTERETTQPNRDALAYWASGLELIYLEGALTRAR